MIISTYSSFILTFILLSYSSNCSAYDHSLYSGDYKDPVETPYDENQQSDVDEYFDPMKYEKASYKHEQSLLANIYSPSRTYISMHDDRIHPSNFSYFTFNSVGTYRFILISLRGDADLYVSTRHKHVNYSNYEYSSCTCGIDEIFIEPFVKRPIYIGVYGHSQYQDIQYRLLIELVDSSKSKDESSFQSSEEDRFFSDSHEDQTSQTNRQSPPTVTVDSENDGRHLLWNILVWILNVLVEILT